MFARRRKPPSTRSRVESVVERLAVPDDWTVAEFLTELERVRGRRIVRMPLHDEAPVGLCGLWLELPDHDLVMHRQADDPIQERHVVGHEAAHMLLGHAPNTQLSRAGLATFLSGLELDDLDIDLSMVRAARGADDYDKQDEYEAELLATVIMTRARKDGVQRRDRILRAF